MLSPFVAIRTHELGCLEAPRVPKSLLGAGDRFRYDLTGARGREGQWWHVERVPLPVEEQRLVLDPAEPVA